VIVLQHEIALATVVRLRQLDVREATVKVPSHQPFFNLLEIPTFDTIFTIGIMLPVEILLLAAEILGEKLVQECEVIIVFADLKKSSSELRTSVPRFFLPDIGAFVPFRTELTLVPPFFDIEEQIEPKLVRVHAVLTAQDPHLVSRILYDAAVVAL
jgi:hypothetical protein